MTLDVNSTIWNFICWGRPFRLVSPLLDRSSPETTPIQVECGGDFSTVLTRSGDVYAWWPFRNTLEGQYREAMTELDKDESTKATVPDDEAVIPCYTWEMNRDPTKLPILPNLPDLPATGLSEEERRKETRLIKIAAFGDCLIGLTNQGHVLKVDGLTSGDSIRIWRYVSESARMMCHPFLNCRAQLPNYSEIDRVKEHSAFRKIIDEDGQEIPPQVQLQSDTMLITHVCSITSMSSEFHV